MILTAPYFSQNFSLDGQSGGSRYLVSMACTVPTFLANFSRLIKSHNSMFCKSHSNVKLQNYNFHHFQAWIFVIVEVADNA